MADFVHLHVHSDFSLLDGLSKVSDLARAAADMGMPALALTDHGVMFGTLHFYHAAKKTGIKPIVGCEVYISPRSMTQKDVKRDAKPSHLILLAEDQTGYHNLMQIATAAQLEGFYYKPRVDREFLAAHARGLIALSSCGSGEVPRLLQDNRPQRARKAAEWYRRIIEAGVERVEWPVLYVRSFYFLGKIHENRDDMDNARKYYRRFYEYWKDGDMDRERVQEARRKISNKATS